MIFIVVKFTPKPEYADTFAEKAADFTAATRAEPGNLWFEWSKSVDEDGVYVLVEAFADGAAEAHVQSQHFIDATDSATGLPQYLAKTPDIVNFQLPGESWSKMGEMQID